MVTTLLYFLYFNIKNCSNHSYWLWFWLAQQSGTNLFLGADVQIRLMVIPAEDVRDGGRANKFFTVYSETCCRCVA